MPWYVVTLNLVTQVLFLLLAKDIPYIDEMSPTFLGACGCGLLTHSVFALHFLIFSDWNLWRLLLVNLFTLWTVPLLLLASVVTTPETLVGCEVEGKPCRRARG